MPSQTHSPDQLVDRIALDIQRGTFGPGSWLKQIDLQERYCATRLDIRKALDQLVLKRLLQHVPNRGYHVHAPEPKRLNEIRDIRILLESGAAVDIVKHITTAQIKRIRALAERFQALLMNGTLLEQYEVNLAFHAAINDVCTNRELVKLIGDMRSITPSAPATQWSTHARIEISAREHFEMVDALEQRNAAALQAVIAKHISQSSKHPN